METSAFRRLCKLIWAAAQPWAEAFHTTVRLKSCELDGGREGAQDLKAGLEAGAHTLGQDEKSSVLEAAA